MHDVFIKLKPIKSPRRYGQIRKKWLSVSTVFLTVENFTQLFVNGKVLLAQKYWRDFFNKVDEHKNIPRCNG